MCMHVHSLLTTAVLNGIIFLSDFDRHFKITSEPEKCWSDPIFSVHHSLSGYKCTLSLIERPSNTFVRCGRDNWAVKNVL